MYANQRGRRPQNKDYHKTTKTTTFSQVSSTTRLNRSTPTTAALPPPLPSPQAIVMLPPPSVSLAFGALPNRSIRCLPVNLSRQKPALEKLPGTLRRNVT